MRWTEPAFAVDRRVRACTPEPGAWTTFRGERLKIMPVRLTSGAPHVEPGRVVVEKARVLVGTATAPIALGDVQAAGKKPMRAVDWARGAHLTGDDVLGTASAPVPAGGDARSAE